MAFPYRRDLPENIAALADLAADLRWTWSHEADALWKEIDPDIWARTRNPWTILDDVSQARFAQLAANADFVAEVQRLAASGRSALECPAWFAANYKPEVLGGVAYFNMEFGLSEALPNYAGGLGILGGDMLKTASDLGVPVIGVGLLYQEGYFRQTIDAQGWQQEIFPYNEPASMPILPVTRPDRGWLHIPLELPGRTLHLRVWQATVGRTVLYLLDSNSSLNSPADRGITGKLYRGATETRLVQQLVLGIAGWRTVALLRPEVDVCHMNEGATAFALVERARAAAERSGCGFAQALWATRAGNVFTTHTPVAVAFDRFSSDLVRKYLTLLPGLDAKDTLEVVLALGRADPADQNEPVNTAYLGARGAAKAFGVSRLHGAVSRHIFRTLFPRWPEEEIPIGYVTNGVHVPSWDSQEADALWTKACGKDRWRAMPDRLSGAIDAVSDETLWTLRGASRVKLVDAVRERFARQLDQRGFGPAAVERARPVLDPNILTLCFARRITAYKRPNLLLRDPARLARILNHPERPVQIVLAGKAHPADEQGKRLLHEWLALVQRPEFRSRIVFVEDYDISVAQEMVQGADVWINTPRRGWEACGTSGMKVLVNGGLNLSALDGWWDEAYAPDLGWAIDGRAGEPSDLDGDEAAQLYDTLESHVIPEFYDRAPEGIPRAWLKRIRRSMAVLTPRYASTRMLRDYLDAAYLSASASAEARMANGAEKAVALRDWEIRVRRHWPDLHIGESGVTAQDGRLAFAVPVYLGGMAADDVAVELYGEPRAGETPVRMALTRAEPIAGAVNGHVFKGTIATARPAEDFTVRIVPRQADALIPAELPLIFWQR
jgi:starch phosphorylase